MIFNQNSCLMRFLLTIKTMEQQNFATMAPIKGHFKNGLKKPRNNHFPPNQNYFPKRNSHPKSKNLVQQQNICSRSSHQSSFQQNPTQQSFSSSMQAPCHICGKTNHNALDCFHRIDYSYHGRYLPNLLKWWPITILLMKMALSMLIVEPTSILLMIWLISLFRRLMVALKQ